MFDVSIPKITKEDLIRRYCKIKPVITIDGKLHSFRDLSLEELSGISYLWDKENNVGPEIPDGTIKEWKGHDFACLHRYGFVGLFKPSICEVLSQIDKLDLNNVVAFEIISSPKTEKDLYKDPLTTIITERGYHVSIVRLYIAAN